MGANCKKIHRVLRRMVEGEVKQMDEQLNGQISLDDYLATQTERKRLPGEMTTFDTRAESNDSVPRDLRYKQIIEIFEDMKPRNLTAKEVAVFMFNRGFTPNAERNFSAPRITELTQKGIVEPAGKTKCRYTGKTVTIYRLRG